MRKPSKLRAEALRCEVQRWRGFEAPTSQKPHGSDETPPADTTPDSHLQRLSNGARSSQLSARRGVIVIMGHPPQAQQLCKVI